jgi:hypothetical protein
MTSKERLQVEVASLTESEAAEVLAFLEVRKHARASSSWPPAFAGIGRSGRNDLGARSEEILQAEFDPR